MSTIAIVVAKTRAGLDAVAAASDLAIIPGTAQSFAGASTYASPPYADAGEIDTAKSGWIALAREA